MLISASFFAVITRQLCYNLEASVLVWRPVQAFVCRKWRKTSNISVSHIMKLWSLIRCSQYTRIQGLLLGYHGIVTAIRPWDEAVVFSEEGSNYATSSEQCTISVNLFIANEGFVITRTDGEQKILLRRSDAIDGKHPTQISRQFAQQILRHASWKRSVSCVARCAAVVGYYK